MRTIWWVMGASAVGKKALIQAAVVNPDVRAALGLSTCEAAWMDDGPLSVDEWIRMVDGTASDVLVRWQFGREAAMSLLDWDGMRHGLMLVVAEPDVHYARMRAREGDRWTQEGLVAEADGVRALATDLGRRDGLPVLVVDTTAGYRVEAPVL